MQKLSATSNFCTIAVHYRAVAYKYKDRTKKPIATSITIY